MTGILQNAEFWSSSYCNNVNEAQSAVKNYSLPTYCKIANLQKSLKSPKLYLKSLTAVKKIYDASKNHDIYETKHCSRPTDLNSET